MADSEDDPKDDPPFAEDATPVGGKMIEVAVIEDPDMFEVGLADQLNNAPMLAFIKDGRTSHAMAFVGPAGEKLLLSMMALVHLLHGTEVESDEAQFVVPEKKKPTLH